MEQYEYPSFASTWNILMCSLADHGDVVCARELHGDGDHGFPAVTAVTPR